MPRNHALTIEMPEDIEQQLEVEWGEERFARRVLEAIALEGYRTEALSAGQVADMLGLSVLETEAFLKECGASLHYTLEDLEQDSQAIENFLKK